MNCREARNDIALWVGQDLDDPARVEHVRRHVASCPECRVHYRRLRQAMSALERADVPATYEVQNSLWPTLSSRLIGPRAARSSEQRRWLPITSFVAACAVLVAVITFDQLPRHQGGGAAQPPIARGALPPFNELATRASGDGRSNRESQSPGDRSERSNSAVD